MASNSEVGHAVNIANFKVLIDVCTAFGVKYNPSNADLTIANMTTLWTDAGAAHATITTALQNAKQPINERYILFKPLSSLTTRVIGILNSTKASASVKKDAKGLADKIRGFKSSKPKTDTGGNPTEDSVSTSHMSYVMRADNFKSLIELLKTVTVYVPNEPSLAIAGLEGLYTNMKAANDNIGTIIAPVDVARIKRDRALYEEETGIVDVAQACKNYVKGATSATAPEYKLVAKIKFTRPPKK
jgi:hypothetical protein